MSTETTPTEQDMTRTHRDEIELTIEADAADLYDNVSKVMLVAEDAARELEFVDEPESGRALDDVRMALRLLDELENDLTHLQRQKRQVESLIDEYDLLTEEEEVDLR
jgi:hypothetical protein